MSKNDDYFANHDVADKWPFTVYHRPIEERILHAVSAIGGRPRALNLGCGLFHAYPRYADLADWSACDLDKRAVKAVQEKYPRLNAFVCDPMPELGDQKYDVIVAKEVIEHVIDVDLWLKRLFAALKPGGRLILSTPNYGLSPLPILEYTVLEVLARRRGFSRFHIHPTKFTAKKLRRALRAIAGPQADIQVERVSWAMVLFAQVTKP
jgi:2-polyprenyl-3-methyl-5-hydroxy-6-metoxy-1,4-benzoquinol methylase